jgi:hypothetical protein
LKLVCDGSAAVGCKIHEESAGGTDIMMSLARGTLFKDERYIYD